MIPALRVGHWYLAERQAHAFVLVFFQAYPAASTGADMSDAPNGARTSSDDADDADVAPLSSHAPLFPILVFDWYGRSNHLLWAL
jgi:hypothetical protein